MAPQRLNRDSCDSKVCRLGVRHYLHPESPLPRSGVCGFSRSVGSRSGSGVCSAGLVTWRQQGPKWIHRGQASTRPEASVGGGMLAALLGDVGLAGTSVTDLDALLATLLRQDVGYQGGASDVRFTFAQRVAVHTTALCQALREHRSEEGGAQISLSDLQLVKRALEVVAAFWVLPMLLNDVGVALSKRVKCLTLLHGKARPQQPPPERADLQLLVALNWMRSLLTVPFVAALVRERHLTDIIAGYLQLCHAPGCWKGTREELRKVEGTFRSFLGTLDVADVIENLLALMGPSSAPWLVKRVGALLSQSLLRPQGVAALLSLLLDIPEARSAPGVLDRTCVLVTSLPRSHNHAPSAYYQQLCQQLAPCFRSSNDAVKRCVAMCVERLMRQDEATVMEHLLDGLAAPLVQVAAFSEARVDWAVADLSLLAIPCGGGGSVAEAFWTWFQKCVRNVLLLACTVRGSASRLREPVAALLHSALRLSEPRLARAMVKCMLLDPGIAAESNFVWRLGETGGAVLVATTEAQPRLWELECSVTCEALVHCGGSLFGDVFAEALSQAYGAHSPQQHPGGFVVCVCIYIPPTPYRFWFPARTAMMMHLAAELLEHPDKLLEDAIQVFVVLRTLLESCRDEELLLALLSIVSAVLSSGAKLQQHQQVIDFSTAFFLQNSYLLYVSQVLVTDLVPALEALQTESAELHAQAAALRAQILDPAAHWRLASAVGGSDATADGDIDSHRAFTTALQDLSDPLLPVRAHGLVALRKLVLSKDRVTMANIPRVLEVLKAQLRHEDSYIFLGAVQALSALGDVCTQQTVPVLCADFLDPLLPDDVRLKIGECCVLVAQRSGQMLPVIAPRFFDCFLRGVRDASPAIRASSLSNIGCMCETLRWALHPYIHEVVFAVRCVLQTELDVLVRRAAVVVFSLVIRGMGDEVAALVRGELSEMVSVLSVLEAGDSDDLVRIHARDASAELHRALSGY
jgi:hypothetical protein